MLDIKVINRSKHPLPEYQTLGSAGVDLRANIDEIITVQPMERLLVPTGLFIALPPGYEAQIRPRSGMAFKKGFTLVNTPGTIDSDYRGEVKVLIINLSTETQIIEDGDRIAQMVISKYETLNWQETDSLEETDRGAGGFGHTGI